MLVQRDERLREVVGVRAQPTACTGCEDETEHAS